MSFADELRNAPQEKAKKEELQLEADWNDFVELFYSYIKGKCRYAAEKGYTNCSFRAFDFVSCLNKEFTYTDSGEYANLRFEQKKLWERIKPRVVLYYNGRETTCFSFEGKWGIWDRIEQFLDSDGLEYTITPEEHEFEKLSCYGYELNFEISW